MDCAHVIIQKANQDVLVAGEKVSQKSTVLAVCFPVVNVKVWNIALCAMNTRAKSMMVKA